MLDGDCWSLCCWDLDLGEWIMTKWTMRVWSISFLNQFYLCKWLQLGECLDASEFNIGVFRVFRISYVFLEIRMDFFKLWISILWCSFYHLLKIRKFISYK
jgi:hypothetical protein